MTLLVNGQAASSGGGGGGGSPLTTGAYADRPASPSAGDAYLVDAGPRSGSLYGCRNGVWTLTSITPPGSLATGLVVLVCGEDLEPIADGQRVTLWPNRALEDLDLTVPSGSSGPVAVASGVGGLPSASFNNLALGASIAVPAGSDGRTLACLIDDTTIYDASYNHVVHWGAASSGQAYGILTKVFTDSEIGNHYWSSRYATGSPGASSSPRRIVARFDGTTDRFFLDGVEIGSGNAKTLSAPVDATFRVGHSVAGGEPCNTKVSIVLAWTRGLSDAEVAALDLWLADRYGL